MKSGLLGLISNIKQKNVELREKVNQDYKRYEMLCNNQMITRITINENAICIFENNQIKVYECHNIETIKSYMHRYFAKSMINQTYAGRYDIFLYNGNSQDCEKLGYFEEYQETTNRRAMITCSNRQIASIIREELVGVYKYVVINETMEKLLNL